MMVNSGEDLAALRLLLQLNPKSIKTQRKKKVFEGK
jgi:hypothetical protein